MKKVFLIFSILVIPTNVVGNQSDIFFSIHGLVNNICYEKIKHHNRDLLGSGILSEFNFKHGKFKIVNQMFLSNDSNITKKGGGKQVKGFYGYTNLGYIAYEADVGSLKNNWIYGRNFVNHGFSKMGDLLISQDSRPFDGFHWKINYKNIEGDFHAIQLEELNDHKRYLTVHSLKLELSKKLTFLFSESSLYSTDKGGFNWQLLNPVIFWVPERENFPTIQANSLLYFGMNFNIKPEFSFYAEILIDDWQINKKSKGDLEPNAFGYISGIELDNFFQQNLIIWMEYTKITNRTYQTLFHNETYTHRGFPIGHYLGNDFDLFQVNFSKEFKDYSFKPYLSIAYHRDGFNGLDTPFDEPWLAEDISLENGYSEVFPTPPIIEKIEVELAIDCRIKKNQFINTGIRLNKSPNRNYSNLELIFRLNLSIERLIKY